MRAAVLGHPVGHSLSPVLHGAAYAALGLRGWSYGREDVTEDGLAAFLDGLGPEWAGLSLTMPLKRAVLGLLDEVSPLAAAVGAANTVTFPGGRRRGDNTDVEGIVAALAEAGARSGPGAVLGGGATAASAVAALQRLGCAPLTAHVRDPGRAGPVVEAAARLGVPLTLETWDGAAVPHGGVADAAVVVSTAPAGAADALAARLAGVLAGRGAAPAGVLLDVVYAPWPSALAGVWADAGGRSVGGFAMLLHQAAGQFRLMTGQEPPVAVMRAAGESALAAAGHARR